MPDFAASASTPEPSSSPERSSSPGPGAPLPPVSVTREGHRRFTGRSQRGGVVAIGDAAVPGTFTPGELLKVALAGCAGFSAEPAITRRLGEDAAITVVVDGDKEPGEDRYARLRERIEIDLSGLDEAAQERLITVIARTIEQACTVGRTLEAGAAIELAVVAADEQRPGVAASD